jgi:uncharacterized membrane-anchored protein
MSADFVLKDGGTLIYTSPSPGVSTAVGDFPGLALMDLMKPYMPPTPENYEQVLRDIHGRVIQMWAGYIWVPTPAAAQLMRSMGNRTDDTFIGAIFPANDDADWMAVVKFVKEGYIKDDDAKDWNADDLLKSLKEGTEAANEERAKRGIDGIEVTGWAQKPQYEAGTHRLVWSALSKKKGSTGDNQGVNYNTYALGREGYLSLNLITNAKDLDTYKPDAAKLLAALQYDDGKKYADFNSSTDKVAAYGLAALVAGVAVKKLGLFALALAFLAKFAKIAVVAGGAALWGIAKIFKKKTPEA